MPHAHARTDGGWPKPVTPETPEHAWEELAEAALQDHAIGLADGHYAACPICYRAFAPSDLTRVESWPHEYEIQLAARSPMQTSPQYRAARETHWSVRADCGGCRRAWRVEMHPEHESGTWRVAEVREEER